MPVNVFSECFFICKPELTNSTKAIALTAKFDLAIET